MACEATDLTPVKAMSAEDTKLEKGTIIQRECKQPNQTAE